MQTDPIGYKDQMNMYAYAGNDPLNRLDPTGMKGLDIDEVVVTGQKGSDCGTGCNSYSGIRDNDPGAGAGGFCPIGGCFQRLGGGTVDLTVNSFGGLSDEDGNDYMYDFESDTVQSYDSGSVESVCPECYLLGGKAIQTGITTIFSPASLGNKYIGHRLFTANRQNGLLNKGKLRFGWSGRNGSSEYKLMLRYKKMHLSTGIKTERVYQKGFQ